MSALKNVKVALPTYDETIPSTKAKIAIHPFKVGDEKVLLMASESKDPKQMTTSLKQVIRNCCDGVDPEKLTSFDLEYLFVKLRSISVGEIAEIGVKCSHCEVTNQIEVDLTKVKVDENPDHNRTIKINDQLIFKMRYPDLDEIATVDGEDVESLLGLICKSVETVFFGEETINIGPAEIDDLKGIIEQLSTRQFQQVQDFFSTSPKLLHDISFQCGDCGQQNNQTLEGLASFF